MVQFKLGNNNKTSFCYFLHLKIRKMENEIKSCDSALKYQKNKYNFIVRLTQFFFVLQKKL